MLAAAALFELTGEAGWADLWRDSAAWLRDEWDPQTGLWTQQLYGRADQVIGPVHGFAGCVLALCRGADDEMHRRAAETTVRYAIEEEGLANWLPRASMKSLRDNRDGSIRTQWCHGAPGVSSHRSLALRPTTTSMGACCARVASSPGEPARSPKEETFATGPQVTGTHSLRSSSARATSCGSTVPGPSRCTRLPRWHVHAQKSAAATTPSGPAIQEQR